MKKALIVGLVVLFCVSAVFARGGAQQGGVGSPAVINLWTHEDPNRQVMEEQFAKDYMAANPHLTINYSVYPSTNIRDLIPTAYAARNAPAIWNLELQAAYPVFMQGLCAPIPVRDLGFRNEQALIDTYLPNMLDPVTDKDGSWFGQRGAIYGLPLEVNNWCIYLNKKIFRDAGLDPDRDWPKTWEEVMSTSERIVRRNGDIITRRGFDFRYPDYLISWFPMVDQLGGAVVSADGREAIVNEAAWVKVLDFMKQWGPEGKNLGSSTMPAARRQFDNDQDEIAMHLSGIYQHARMETANPSFYNSSDWMVIPFPTWEGARRVPNAYYFQYYMVNSQIPQNEQTEAWKFVHYMLGHGDMYLERVALTQPTRAVFNGQLFRSMPFSDVFLDELTNADVVYHSAFSWRINDLINDAIIGVMTTPMTSQQAFQILKREAQAVVDEHR